MKRIIVPIVAVVFFLGTFTAVYFRNKNIETNPTTEDTTVPVVVETQQPQTDESDTSDIEPTENTTETELTTSPDTTQPTTLPPITEPTTTAPPTTIPTTIPNTSPPTTEMPTEETTDPDSTGMISFPRMEDAPDMSHPEDPNAIVRLVFGTGILYNRPYDFFYWDENVMQRQFGFSELYDTGAPLTAMVIDTVRLKFNHNGMDWMYQLWKGIYGMTSGAEIGIYHKPETRYVEHYDCATDENYVTMAFRLYKRDTGELFFRRGPEPHWWLTGFRLGDNTPYENLILHAFFYFDDPVLANKVEAAIVKEGFVKNSTYFREDNNLAVIW